MKVSHPKVPIDISRAAFEEAAKLTGYKPHGACYVICSTAQLETAYECLKSIGWKNTFALAMPGMDDGDWLFITPGAVVVNTGAEK